VTKALGSQHQVTVTALRLAAPAAVCAVVLPLLFFPARSATAQQLPADSLGTLFHEAQAASRDTNYAEAEKLYRRILEAEPSNLSTRINLGLACYWQGKNREAVGEFEKALQVRPLEFSSLLFSGLACLNLGEYARARRALLKAHRVRDTDPLLFWALGSLAMIHGDTNHAVPLLERSVALDPQNVRAVRLLGQAYARLAYRKEEMPLVPVDYAALTEQALRWIEQRQPNSALAHVFQGDVLAARSLSSDALAEYRRALQIGPNWPDIHLLIGNLQGLLGRWDEALAELHEHLALFPGDPRALLEIGVISGRSGNYADAVPYLQQAVARDPGSYEARYRLGEAYVNLRKYAEAVPRLEEAWRLNPGESAPYYLLHRAYRALHNDERAAWAMEQFKARKSPTEAGSQEEQGRSDVCFDLPRK